MSSSAPNGASEHPPSAPCTGENFTVNIINKIMQGPHWNETAIILTWDDFGGLYDHVTPPVEKLHERHVLQRRLPAARARDLAVREDRRSSRR